MGYVQYQNFNFYLIIITIVFLLMPKFQSMAAKMEFLRSKIEDAQKIIQLKKEEAKLNAERSAKAEWALSLCNARVKCKNFFLIFYWSKS